MEISLVLMLVVLGAFVGLMAGLLGIGGGGIMVPAFTVIFIDQHLPIDNVVHLALGTSMACIIVTSLSSMRAHHANGAVDWGLVKRMAPGIMMGTFFATFLAASASSKSLAVFFACFMAYVSFQMFKGAKKVVGAKRAGNTELAAVSLGIGAVSALVSIGGGSITVPYLTWRSVDVKKAIGTSAALGFPIALTGTIGYMVNGLSSGVSMPDSFGFIYLPALFLVSALSFFTAPLGAKLTQRLPVSTLKKVFGLLLILLSLKMLFSVI